MDVENSKLNAVVTLKINNNRENVKTVLQQVKPFVLFETILGVNRLFLYDYGKLVFRISFVWNMFLVLQSITVLIFGDIYSTSQVMFKDVMAIEYLLLPLIAVLQRKKLKKFFLGLQSFDEHLNIQNDDSFLTITTRFSYLAIAAILSYNAIENILSLVLTYFYKDLLYLIYVAYLTFIMRETETVFLCILLLMVLKRLCVIRAHVAKLFDVKAEVGKNCTSFKKVEATLKNLTNKVDLDITSLHKAYDLLHQCSEQLNSVLSIPILIMITASGISTVMVMKNTILLFQHGNKIYNIAVSKGMAAFALGRCLKSIIFLIIPCYHANISKEQVEFIRSMTYNTLTTTKLDKVERRKIKAFFQLTRINEFTYALCGIVRFDMSFPLRFLSTCLTYLIIVLQFSKFID